ncbi:hypothetical protein WJX81_002362 [Elliptochloris bilobata]|uniref:Uncharacterized protein n=1 Tax=Elliptochloris bilobata TaxID=381761 RepID=A0AAW1S9Z5_9CHLO
MPRIVDDIPRRLPRSWPLLDRSFDAWGAAHAALQALWPPEGRGVPWALLFLALLVLAGLYEVAAFLTDALWGGGLDQETMLEQEASVRRVDALCEAEDAEAAAAQDRQRRLRMGLRLVQLRKAKKEALRAGAAEED